MRNRESRLVAAVILAMCVPGFGRAQSVLSTIIGGAPEGMQAGSATLDTPTAVVTDAEGNVYAALKGSHQVIRIDTGGFLHVFAGNGTSGSAGDGGKATAASLAVPVSLAMDAAGNLYIADSQANRIRRVGTDGIITTVAGNGRNGFSGDGGPATSASLKNPAAVALDKSGNLLIADSWNHVIRKVAADGTITTVAGTPGKGGDTGDDGPALSATLNAPAGVLADSAGNIYVADTGNNWVRMIAPDGTITRVAGKDPAAGSFMGGVDTTLAVNKTIVSPTSLAMDSDGNLYILSYAGARVWKVTPAGKISSFAGTGTAGTAGDGGLANAANINAIGISTDAQNNMYLADGVSNRVRKITASTGVIDTIGGVGLPSYGPRSLILNNQTIYFSDTNANLVRKYDLSTGTLSVVAGNGQAGYSGDEDYDVYATGAKLNGPRGLAFDPAGKLYIVDTGNNRVRVVDTDNYIHLFAGTGETDKENYGTGDDYQASQATLDEPVDIVIDSVGDVYILERAGHVVRKVTPDGTITTVAGVKNADGTGAGGTPTAETGVATEQRLNYPQAMSFDLQGNLLIADTGNNRVRKYSPSDGTITTVAGGKTSGSGGDGGQATSAQLRNPAGVAMDSVGNTYISDSNNNKIRRVDTDGIITTVAGNGTGAFNGDGSPATAYSLSGPSALAPLSACSVLFSDTNNQRIRKVQTSVDYTITTNPAGLQVTLDGTVSSTPLTAKLLPGTTHDLNAPSPQSGAAGTRYLSTGAQSIAVPCGPAKASASVTFTAQYSLTVVTGAGGSVTPAAEWQNAGVSVTLEATPTSGYAFAGWGGDCTGKGSCQLVMNGPRSVTANFVAAQIKKATITSGGVMGAGLSVPPVTALSTNAIAIVFGTDFAPAGTLITAGKDNLVDGKLPTNLGGVCVLVNSAAAPLLAVTATQINFQVPQVPDAGTVAVQVITGCGTAGELHSGPASVVVQSASPEFFYYVQTSGGQNPIAAVNGVTGEYIGAPGLISGTTTVPAKPGDVLTLYATGFGATNPSYSPGALPEAAASITGTLEVTVASIMLPAGNILYAGVTPSSAGVYQLNVRLPDSLADGDQPVQITVNGIASPAGGYITVKR